MTDDEIQAILNDVHTPIYIAKHDSKQMATLFTGRRTVRALKKKTKGLAASTGVGRIAFAIVDSKIVILYRHNIINSR